MPDKLLRLRQTFWFFSCWFGATILGALLMQLCASAFGIGNWQQLISKIKSKHSDVPIILFIRLVASITGVVDSIHCFIIIFTSISLIIFFFLSSFVMVKS